MRPISPWTVELVKHFEGCKLEPYHDPMGYPTIGYGHLLSRVAGEPLDKYPAITPAQAEDLLLHDLSRTGRSVLRLVPVPLTEGQWAALVDFAFNCGAGNLQVSALRQKVLRGEHLAAAEQFSRWVYSRHVKLRGLVRRRAAESELYLSSLPETRPE